MAIRSRLKKWFRRLRNLQSRARLRGSRHRGERVVMASTWDFPNPTHAYAYQEMLGFLGLGLDVRVFYGDRRPGEGLAARFEPLLRRAVPVETVREIHEADLAVLDRRHPGRVDAFLQRVAAEVRSSVAALRRDPIVLRASTFARMVELAGARYLQSWFFYDQSFMAMFASQVLGIPRGLSCHVDHQLDDHPFKLVALQLATADLVLAISRRTRDELIRIGGPEHAAKIVVKRIGVDGTALRPQRGREPVGDAIELVSICRLEPKKGLPVLVEACDHLRRRGARFRVRLFGGEDRGHAGSAAHAGLVRTRIAEAGLGDVVLLEGAVAHDRVPDILASAHAFVAPYVEVAGGDKDGIPTAVVEAMGAGRPVICSDVGAIGEAVQDGVEGLLVPQGDATALAEAIERLAGDAELRARLGRAAAARFDREFDCRVTDVDLHRRVLELVRR